MKNYVFAEKLGSGTYATVYKAFRKSSRREVVAIKCVDKKSLNKTSTENLLTEIEILKKLNHDHIVRLIDFEWDDQYIYLVMEYCGGGDLSKFIKTRRRLPEHLVKRLLQQFALALFFLRANGVSHMDLKPHNVLLSSNSDITCERSVIKLGDFGFAQYLQNDTEAVHLRGSPLYMAPEIIIKRQYDPKADLWSLGVIMFECLFGRAPFHSQSLGELQDKILDTKPVEVPLGNQISDSCRDLLTSLLKRDPKERIDFDSFFAHPFLDLDHAPSPECLPKAVNLVTEAVEKDIQHKYKEAVHLYCKALEYFVPAILYESDPEKKVVMRQKVKEYMNRAEEVKGLLKPQHPVARPSSAPSSPKALDELKFLCKGHSELESALNTLISGVHLENEDNYLEAMEKYEAALDIFVRKILPNEPKGHRKDLILSEVNQCMTRAENIKMYLSVKNINTETQPATEESQEEQTSYMKMCVLQ